MSYYIRKHYIIQDDQVHNLSKYLLAMGESLYDNILIKTLVYSLRSPQRLKTEKYL